MGMRACCIAAALALCGAPVASAGRSVSVGYRMPSALHGLRVVARVPALHTAEVRVAGAAQMRELRRRPGIRWVRPLALRTKADAPGGLGLAAPDWQWTATHQDLVPDWVRAAASSVTIAVVDTGADVDAPSISAKSPVTWNVATGRPAVTDPVGHGTFVASLAAGAPDDETGVAGFGGDARLMIVQANRGAATFSDVDEARAIVWAVDNGARIVNLSIAGSSTSPVERAAIRYATSRGVLLVAAAGNAAQDGNPRTYPAALIGRSGLVVGAATQRGTRAPFSTTGRYVDVLAPGVDVLGALTAGGGSSRLFAPASIASYGYGSGTSYAAPEVAGAAALVWAANPLLDATAVATLISGTTSQSGVWSTDLAFGNIDVAAAVARAQSGSIPVLTYPSRKRGVG
jgi:subtilisin family serine protease